MLVGRFFSLGQGRVGQYLSPRVLLIRTPFQRISRADEPNEFCCFGFNHLKQAQKFAQFLASMGLNFRLHQHQTLKNYPYEVSLVGHADLAGALAYWDRRDRDSAATKSKMVDNVADSPVTRHPSLHQPKIVA